MTFRYIYNSTTADYQDCNNNFLHIGQGNLWPRGGSTLNPTTNVYDLGSSTYRWKNVVVNNVYCDSITTGEGLWHKIVDTTLTTTSASIEITGLTNTTDIMVVSNIKGEKPATTFGTFEVKFVLNNDSSSSYWFIRTQIYLTYIDTTYWSSTTYGYYAYAPSPFTLTTDYVETFQIMKMRNNSTHKKMVDIKNCGYNASGTSAKVFLDMYTILWGKTEAMYSLKLYCHGAGLMRTNTNIRIYAKQ